MTTDDAWRSYIRRLFADPDAEPTPDQAPDPAKANVVPEEGRSPAAPADADEEQRQFVRELFDRSLR